MAFLIFFGVHIGESLYKSILSNIDFTPSLREIFGFQLKSLHALEIFALERSGSPGLLGIKVFSLAN